MATADEIRRLREETSIFSRLFDLARQQGESLEQEGRRPVLGGLLSKEPVMGTDTIRYEGITPLLLNLIEPIARGIDAPRAAAQNLIPQEDMISEAFGTAGTAMIGGGLAAKPSGALGANVFRDTPNQMRNDQVLVRIPIKDVEHGESAVPGGKLTWPNAPKLIEEYARKDTDLPPIEIIADEGGMAMIADGSHRFEAAKLRGQNYIDAYVKAEDLPDLPSAEVVANASKSAGLLSVASDVAERGDQILNMLKSGRADDITDSMFDMRDPVKNTQLNQYLFENYDLPMDEASRMARAREMGFDVDNNLYHGTAPSMYSDDKFSPNIDAFRVSKKGQLGSGVYATTDIRKANTFSNAGETNRGDFDLLNPSPRGGSILPIIAKNENPASFRQMRNAQYQLGDVSDFNDLSQRGTQELLDQQFTSVRSGNEINIFDPANIRSRFARFDPRLSHLSNITAANASPISGILAQSGVSENQAQRIEDYLRKRGLLD